MDGACGLASNIQPKGESNMEGNGKEEVASVGGTKSVKNEK